MAGVLAGRRIVVPETRELDILAQMLERQGATAIRCPLVSVRDTDDEAAVLGWLNRFAARPPEDLILMTGEALQRLLGFARRSGLDAAFRTALGRVRKITRGPKPLRRLREIGLDADIQAEPPTSEGVMAALAELDLSGHRVGIALYPDFDSGALLGLLERKRAAADPVLSYVYASKTEDRRVVEVIEEMADGRIDLIAFTSSPQIRRLEEVAKSHQRQTQLEQALQRTTIAAVGPVVGRAIEAAGARVSIMPERFHMKPMVNAIIAALNRTG
jgi:uroporphyrinogen-III synthase